MAPSCAYFSEEILTQIFKRLPVKSLVRFRCVQKSWLNLIDDPYFINVHSSDKRINNKHLLFSSSGKTSFVVRFDDKQCKVYRPWTSILNHIPGYHNLNNRRCVTSGGLLCLSGFEGRVQHVYLWNLLIGKVKTLPNSPIPCDDDPLIRLVQAGVAFGYLAKINDYKVIKLEIYVDTRGEPQLTFVYVNVYSLTTNSWKTPLTIDNFSGSSSFEFLYDSVVVNGAAYWIGSKAESEKVIVCFDMDKEIFREISLPQSDKFSAKLLGFGEILYVFYEHESIVQIWTLEGDIEENCTKKVTLDLNNIRTSCRPLGISNNGDLVLKCYFEIQHLFYDIDKAETTKVVEDNSWCCFKPVPPCAFFMSGFDESLVLLGDDRSS